MRRLETILALVGGGAYLHRLHAEIAEKLRGLEDFNIEEVKRNAVNATVQEIVEGAKDEETGASIPVIWGRRG